MSPTVGRAAFQLSVGAAVLIVGRAVTQTSARVAALICARAAVSPGAVPTVLFLRFPFLPGISLQMRELWMQEVNT